MALKASCLVLASMLLLGIGGGVQRNASQKNLPLGDGRSKPPVIKPLTPAARERIYEQNGVIPLKAIPVRYYEVQHPIDTFGQLYFANAPQVDFAEKFVELRKDSGQATSYFIPIAAHKKHLTTFTIAVFSSGTASLEARADDGSWKGPTETVPVANGANYVSIVFEPKSATLAGVTLRVANTPFYFYNVTTELVKAKP